MSQELYGKIIAQLMTDVSMTSNPDEKHRLTVLCGQVIEASGLGK